MSLDAARPGYEVPIPVPTPCHLAIMRTHFFLHLLAPVTSSISLARPTRANAPVVRCLVHRSCDTKAVLACALDVLNYAHSTGQKPKYDLLICGTIDEEAG